jgi:TorA maturation chaperone TorD
MVGASTHTDDERPTLGKRTMQRTALTVRTTMREASSPSRPDQLACACRTAQSMPFRNCATVEFGGSEALESPT